MATDKFAVFILTHGRPDKVITYKSLRRQGYTGDVYLIIDNEDKTEAKYREVYGDKVIVFDKAKIAREFDEGDNFNDRRSVFYARNACFGIAQDLGLDYFLELDDDYTGFRYKYGADFVYKDRQVRNLDKLFAIVLDYYKTIPALTIAFAQGGDFLGGSKSGYSRYIWLKRKAMNSFFCSTKRPFSFMGRVNEDVNTYTTRGHRGDLLLSFSSISVEQMQTQANSGGMSEMYIDSGTYIKSFYTVMYCPSGVRVSDMRSTHARIHHRITWANTVPCIVGEEHRKRADSMDIG